MVHFRGGRAAIDITSYPDIEQFFEDLAAVYRAEIAALAEAGCTYIQLDDTNLAYLCASPCHVCFVPLRVADIIPSAVR